MKILNKTNSSYVKYILTYIEELGDNDNNLEVTIYKNKYDDYFNFRLTGANFGYQFLFDEEFVIIGDEKYYMDGDQGEELKNFVLKLI
jgi:hypothetical protein